MLNRRGFLAGLAALATAPALTLKEAKRSAWWKIYGSTPELTARLKDLAGIKYVVEPTAGGVNVYEHIQRSFAREYAKKVDARIMGITDAD